MTPLELESLHRLADQMKDHATRCRAEAVATGNVYYKNHLLGRASAFDDAAWAILERWPKKEVGE